MEKSVKTLYIIATPIGNLDDISPRAIQILKIADYIFAEDTRHSSILLNRFDIRSKLISLHKFNEMQKLEKFKSVMSDSATVALISDAGTPLISDPGNILVDFALNNNIRVSPIPGPSALTSILSVSGFSSNKISFLGFLPHTVNAKTKTIKEELSQQQTIVFFESPRRIVKTIEIISALFPDTQIVIGREISKLHEQIIRFKAADFSDIIDQIPVKGEFVIAAKNSKNINKVQNNFNQDPTTGDVTAVLANYLNLPKKKAYKLLLELKEKE